MVLLSYQGFTSDYDTIPIRAARVLQIPGTSKVCKNALQREQNVEDHAILRNV